MMKESSTEDIGHLHPLGQRPSASLLVRCWLEPQREDGEAPVLRGTIQNLKTGEKTYIGDLGSVGKQIMHHLGGDQETSKQPSVINEVHQGRKSS